MTEKKSFLESIAETGKPESFAEEKFEYIHNGGKTKKLLTLGIVVILLIAAAFAITALTGRVSVPDLAGMSLEDTYLWAQKNRITLAVKNEYSFAVPEKTILAQDVLPGRNIKKNTILPVIVSLGPDPEEVIAFPDLKAMTLGEVEAWISEHKLTGVRVETTYSDVVAENQVISYSLTDGTEELFKRKNRVTITVSRGSAALSETVIVADFANLKAAAVLQWGAENGVTITLAEAFDQYISAGTVVSQSIKKGTEIKRTDRITVVISKGKPVTVPNFTAMLKDEASAWAKASNITLTILDRYTDSHQPGKIYDQSKAAGQTIAEGETIRLYYSLGRVEVQSFIGKTKLEILKWQQDVNARGANISLAFAEAYGEKGTAGTIISQSIRSDLVNTGTMIAVVISKGMRLVTPDFSGMNKEQVELLSKQIGLKVLYDFQHSEEVERGIVIDQSIPKDTLITDADTITVILSL